MRLARILTPTTVLMFIALPSSGQDRFDITQQQARDESAVVCADGLAGGDCRLAQGIVRLSIKSLNTSVPDWRVVIIPESRWANAAATYGIKSTKPAFTDLAIRTTYLEGSLILSDGRVDENLQRYTSSNGMTRLVWVIAHEYGHILCGTRDEQKASAAAGRLIYGRTLVCR
jgi:hypothetical protein